MPDSTNLPNDLSSYWMPFTANKKFKKIINWSAQKSLVWNFSDLSSLH